MPKKDAAQPLVSVLLLTWNHEEYIRACFDSILADAYRKIEIICCENGSSDGTWAVLQKIKAEHPDRQIILFQNPPKTSVTKGFNDMLAKATGELVCLFSGDDLFCKDRVAWQVALFSEQPELEVTYANGLFLGGPRDGAPVHDDARCQQVFSQPATEVLHFMFENRGLMIQALMARRTLLTAVGGFDAQATSDDWILNIRMFSALRSAEQYSYVPFNTFLYRQHGSNTFKNFRRQSSSMIEVINKYYHAPDRARQMARMYWYQFKVGVASYRGKPYRLVAGYLLKAAVWWCYAVTGRTPQKS